MNIRQLHDELRKPGPCRILLGDIATWTVDKYGNVHLVGDGDLVCTISDLERDDWSVTRAKSRPSPPQTGGGE